MAVSLNLAPAGIDIVVTRGDTLQWTFTVLTSTGAAQDIAGFVFLFTVDPEVNPVNSSNNLFQLTGTILDAPNGVVAFSMSTLQANQTPGVYYYDLQMTDGASRIRTIAKGKFEFRQDITK